MQYDNYGSPSPSDNDSYGSHSDADTDIQQNIPEPAIQEYQQIYDKYITFINNGDGGQDSIDLQQQPSISIKCN